MEFRIPIKHTNESYEINPSKIIAVGANYRDHIAESKSMNVKSFTPEIPEEPILFPKTPNVLIPSKSSIILPKFIYDYNFDETRIDYEAELAFIIKNRCKSVTLEQAKNYSDYILGFTCFNDVSCRNIQTRDKSGWFRGKSFDTFGPIGPVLVRPENIGDPQNLEISCTVNGKLVQQSNTKHMIFSIPRLIEFISHNFTLEKGDIIITGTPSGVGPLKDGDMVEIEIEGIGILRNSVKME